MKSFTKKKSHAFPKKIPEILIYCLVKRINSCFIRQHYFCGRSSFKYRLDQGTTILQYSDTTTLLKNEIKNAKVITLKQGIKANPSDKFCSFFNL
jgi:hypothetical protein